MRRQWAWRCVTPRAMSDTRLSGADYRVLMAVDSFDQMGAGGRHCVASRSKIAERISAHRSTVANSLRKLCRLGYLAASGRERGAKSYRVVFDEVARNGATDADSVARNGATEGTTPKVKKKDTTSKMARADAPASSMDAFKGEIIPIPGSAEAVASDAMPAWLSGEGITETLPASIFQAARENGVTEAEIREAGGLAKYSESIGGDFDEEFRARLELYVESPEFRGVGRL